MEQTIICFAEGILKAAKHLGISMTQQQGLDRALDMLVRICAQSGPKSDASPDWTKMVDWNSSVPRKP